MSVTLIARAYEYAVETGLAPTRRLVLYVMADAADDDGRLWPGQKRLRRLTGLSVSTIRAAIREFEGAGILSTNTRLRSEGRGRTSNLYLLDFHAPAVGASSEDQPPAPGGPPRQHTADQPPSVGGPIDRRTVREPQGRTVSEHTPDDLPPGDGARTAETFALPTIISAPLRLVADRKDAVLDVGAVDRALKAYPDRDHAEEAEKFAAWHLHGGGQNVPLSNVATGFRNWLKRSPAVEPGKTKLALVQPPLDLEAARAGLPALEKAWQEIQGDLLTAVDSEATYRLWLEPLVPAGRIDGDVFLTAPEGIRAWAERRYASLIGEALARSLGSKVRVRFLAPPDEAAEAA
jgi:hypothetical protein